jgi:hypothetical protein
MWGRDCGCQRVADLFLQGKEEGRVGGGLSPFPICEEGRLLTCYHKEEREKSGEEGRVGSLLFPYVRKVGCWCWPVTTRRKGRRVVRRGGYALSLSHIWGRAPAGLNNNKGGTDHGLDVDVDRLVLYWLWINALTLSLTAGGPICPSLL